MKILLVANLAKEFVLKFQIPTLQSLQQAGHIVDVACHGEEKIPFCRQQFKMPFKRSPFSFGTWTGIRKMRQILTQEKYDLVYCHTPVGGGVARLAARPLRKQGLKVIYFAHGFHFYKGAPLLNWFIWYPLEKLMAHWTDAIITINEEDYNNARNLLKCKNIYRVHGIGINLERFKLPNRSEIRRKYRDELHISQEALVLIYAAELIPNKNQQLLIRTLALLRKQGTNAYLVLPGIDHNQGRDMQLAKQLQVAPYVRCLGWRQDIENLYAMADICTASSIREGLGLNILEAMASDLPVVATQNRGHATVIQESVNGFLVPLNDPEKMAKKIHEAITKSDDLISRYQLSNYTQAQAVQTLITILNKTVTQ